MAPSNFLDNPQDGDHGSEGALGFEFQRQVALRKCLEMLIDADIVTIVCEFHEDIVRVAYDKRVDLLQVKKKETGPWTLADLLKCSKKNRSILYKLFHQLEIGKDVRSMRVASHGGFSSKKEDYSLSTLVSLLETPKTSRDEAWIGSFTPIKAHLIAKLGAEGISESVVGQGLEILTVDLSYPHPEAIEAENKIQLNRILNEQFEVELSVVEVADVYGDLYERVKRISTAPRQHWTVKSFSKDQVIEIIGARLISIGPLKNRQQILTLQQKLDSADLEARRIDAIEQRMRALLLKKTLNLSSLQWQRFKTLISLEWETLMNSNRSLKGAELWEELTGLFERLGDRFSREDERLNFDFVQGVFFDMTAICDARFYSAYD